MMLFRLAAAALLTTLLPLGGAAQEVPPGPAVNVTMVTQLSPQIPQYLRVDIPRLREGILQRSGGRIQVTLASWPERNLTGPELLRVLRAGQIESAASHCRRSPATCRSSTSSTSPACSPRTSRAAASRTP
jgi:hypothetical protein